MLLDAYRKYFTSPNTIGQPICMKEESISMILNNSARLSVDFSKFSKKKCITFSMIGNDWIRSPNRVEIVSSTISYFTSLMDLASNPNEKEKEYQEILNKLLAGILLQVKTEAKKISTDQQRKLKEVSQRLVSHKIKMQAHLAKTNITPSIAEKQRPAIKINYT
jgi:hypothetical protein